MAHKDRITSQKGKGVMVVLVRWGMVGRPSEHVSPLVNLQLATVSGASASTAKTVEETELNIHAADPALAAEQESCKEWANPACPAQPDP